MRRRYDKAIEDGYHATERTNFYDSIYSPVILIVSAAVTALVLVLSASGNGAVRSLFGMSVGTAVAVISYISQVFTPLESIGMEIQTVRACTALTLFWRSRSGKLRKPQQKTAPRAFPWTVWTSPMTRIRPCCKAFRSPFRRAST